MKTVRSNLSFPVSDKMLKRMIGSLAYQMDQANVSVVSAPAYDSQNGRRKKKKSKGVKPQSSVTDLSTYRPAEFTAEGVLNLPVPMHKLHYIGGPADISRTHGRKAPAGPPPS